MPVKKKSKSQVSRARSLAAKKAWRTRKRNMRRGLSSSSLRSSRRKCPLSSEVKIDGRCSSKIPCVDGMGNVVPYATRGSDGQCRIKSCGKGKIMDYETGKCISTDTPRGHQLKLAKKADDAKRFLNAYTSAALGAGLKTPGYYDEFKPNRFAQARRKEVEDSRTRMQERLRERQEKIDARNLAKRQNADMIRNLKENLRRGDLDPNTGKRSTNVQAGRSSFSFF